MIITFLAAVVTTFLGIIGMGRKGKASQRSNRLMQLRVALCFALLLEMLVYYNLNT